VSETADLAKTIADGIAVGIATALAGAKAPEGIVQHTSIDVYEPSEVTVRFRRWMTFNGTAYQRGQTAGFTRAQIADLERRGIVDVVQTRDTAPALRRAVTK
jgi:hypothetical protein